MSRALPSRFSDELAGTPYRHVRPLAQGGMGEVHVVEHRELGDQVVLKVVRAQLLEHEDALTQRLRAEARTLRALRHPNLVEVLDFGFTSAGRAYLVTELLHGETLKEAVSKRGPLELSEACEVLRQTLDGLEVAHAKDVAHRDIKPDNLFWTTGEAAAKRCVKILDFGVAKLMTEEAKARGGQVAPTQDGMIVGTPLYCAPEQALAQRVDARADLYALGAVAFFLLLGRPPFVVARGPTAQADLLVAHLQEPVPRPSSLRSDLPAALDAFIERAMQKRAEDRFQTAAEMRDALVAMLEPAHAPRAPRGGTIPMPTAQNPAQIVTPRQLAPAEARGQAGAGPGGIETIYETSPLPRPAIGSDEVREVKPARGAPAASAPAGPSAERVRRPDLEDLVLAAADLAVVGPARGPARSKRSLLASTRFAVVIGLACVAAVAATIAWAVLR